MKNQTSLEQKSKELPLFKINTPSSCRNLTLSTFFFSFWTIAHEETKVIASEKEVLNRLESIDRASAEYKIIAFEN